MKSANDLNRWDGPYDPIGDLRRFQLEIEDDKMVHWDYLIVLYETIKAMNLIGLSYSTIVGECKGLSYNIAKTHAEITRQQVEEYLKGWLVDRTDSS